LQAALADSIAAHGIPVKHLPSGAGHDAMELVNIAPMAMLFVRCGNGGISHNPLETMTEDDAQTATSVLLHFLEHFDPASLKKV
jgi:acetylornithine deacetylase/succinyl-diaminopimelate desuccinylase-like protein